MGSKGPIETEIPPNFVFGGFSHGKIILGVTIRKFWKKDTRVSGYMLESALQAGFISSGVDVKLAGPIPPPNSFISYRYL
ncbi:MAG: hypothetical protein CM15mP12_1200 [Gammaproteobacteria bacterium]|nr:MAG: hypothetical protein CM15mP12_1200 [Gammaproteobacteria bacterium]